MFPDQQPPDMGAMMAPPSPEAGGLPPSPPAMGPDPGMAGGLPPGLDQAIGQPDASGMGGFPSLDPAQLGSFLYGILKKMQTDDQFAMQMQMQMAMAAMGDQQKMAAEQALGALQQAMAADAQTLDGPGSLPPPGAPAADVPADEMDNLKSVAYNS